MAGKILFRSLAKKSCDTVAITLHFGFGGNVTVQRKVLLSIKEAVWNATAMCGKFWAMQKM